MELQDSCRLTVSSLALTPRRRACATSSPIAVRTKPGLYCDEHAALAHRRLSIVDLRAGQQPLANEDGTSGWSSTARSTTTPRSAASSKRTATATAPSPTPRRSSTPTSSGATTACDRFRGMFAFAIWDAPKRRLLLVRDRLGDQAALLGDAPATRLLFGSEIKATARERPGRARPNTRRFPRCSARGTCPATETMFRGVYKLLPGHLLVFEDGAIATRQYWDVPPARLEQRLEPTGPTAKSSRGSGTARRIGAPAADERRAARHVPVGRHRQQRHRGADGAA